MKAKITNFRRSRRIVTGNQMVITLPKVESVEAAGKYVGKEVSYNTGKSLIKGKITSAHGNSGAMRVLFEKGMPGQAIGGEVDIL